MYPQHLKLTSGMPAVPLAERVLTLRSPAWHPSSDVKASETGRDRSAASFVTVSVPFIEKSKKATSSSSLSMRAKSSLAAFQSYLIPRPEEERFPTLNLTAPFRRAISW